jgi:NAD(P)-dependent dehydrogenase (short-subunit alcohol dehydrogenase family)
MLRPGFSRDHNRFRLRPVSENGRRVTGASAGIGKAIAFALAREGVDVAICARRKEPLEAAASQIARETNRKIVAIPADLTKPADAAAFVNRARAVLGRFIRDKQPSNIPIVHAKRPYAAATFGYAPDRGQRLIPGFVLDTGREGLGCLP